MFMFQLHVKVLSLRLNNLATVYGTLKVWRPFIILHIWPLEWLRNDVTN